jgi:hypothetical protein
MLKVRILNEFIIDFLKTGASNRYFAGRMWLDLCGDVQIIKYSKINILFIIFIQQLM